MDRRVLSWLEKRTLGTLNTDRVGANRSVELPYATPQERDQIYAMLDKVSSRAKNEGYNFVSLTQNGSDSPVGTVVLNLTYVGDSRVKSLGRKLARGAYVGGRRD
jgi:hypothetical protein